MAPIKPRNSRRGSKRNWLLPAVIVLVLASITAYGFFTLYRILDSQEYKAERLDFAILSTEADGSYYMLRTKVSGKALNVEFPLYSTVDGKNGTIDPASFMSSRSAVNKWLGLTSDSDFHWQMSENLVHSLSEALGIEASTFEDFIDRLAFRGLRILDYWRLGRYIKIIKAIDPDTNITAAGFAAFLKRLSDSQITRFEVETLTQYPVLVYDNENGTPQKRIYINQTSIEKLKTSMEQ